MNKIFKTKVNNSIDLDLSESDIESADIITIGQSKFHILENNKSHNAELVASDFDSKIYEVKVDNKIYKVNIISDLDELIKQLGFEIGSSKKVNEVKAPMPGLILDILVEKGQNIKEDESLLILEAMKMENILSAPRDGVIKSISINKGDAVEKNQLLIEFE